MPCSGRFLAVAGFIAALAACQQIDIALFCKIKAMTVWAKQALFISFEFLAAHRADHYTHLFFLKVPRHFNNCVIVTDGRQKFFDYILRFNT